ncbi:MAG: hypothetical protein M3Z24_15130, partial [Chloroflexota bacterium]|nr:hypothetical protein [Chloroflexota bacterium]
MTVDIPLNDNYVILPQNLGREKATSTKIFLLAGDSGWTLPQLHYTEASAINRAMKEQLGVDVTVLACVYDRYKDPERDDTHHVYALENHSQHLKLPANARWVSR